MIKLDKQKIIEKILNSKYIPNLGFNKDQDSDLQEDEEQEKKDLKKSLKKTVKKEIQPVKEQVQELHDFIIPKDTQDTSIDFNDKQESSFIRGQENNLSELQEEDEEQEDGSGINFETGSKDKKGKSKKKNKKSKKPKGRFSKTKKKFNKAKSNFGKRISSIRGAKLGTVAMVAGTAAELYDGYEDFTTADSDYERTEAIASTSFSIAGGLAGAAAGGEAGAFVGSIIPGLGTLVGGLAGSAIGFAIGSQMGDDAGKKITEMIEGPIDKIPDDKRDNPFMMDDYMRHDYIPLIEESINTTQDPDKKKELLEDLKEAQKTADGIIKKETVQEWFNSEIDNAKLSDTSNDIKIKYLKEIIKTIPNPEYQKAANAYLEDSFPEDDSSIISTVSDFIFGKPSKEEDNKKLEKAKKLIEYNKQNGTKYTLNSSKNFDILEDKGIIDTNFFGEDKITDWDAISSLPDEVIKELIEEGDFSEAVKHQLEEIRKIKNQVKTSNNYSIYSNDFIPEETSVKPIQTVSTSLDTKTKELTEYSKPEPVTKESPKESSNIIINTSKDNTDDSISHKNFGSNKDTKYQLMVNGI